MWSTMPRLFVATRASGRGEDSGHPAEVTYPFFRPSQCLQRCLLPIRVLVPGGDLGVGRVRRGLPTQQTLSSP